MPTDRERLEALQRALRLYWRSCCNILVSAEDIKTLEKFCREANIISGIIQDLKPLMEESKTWVNGNA